MSFIVVNGSCRALALPAHPGAAVKWVPLDSDEPLWKFATQWGATKARDMLDHRAMIQRWRGPLRVCPPENGFLLKRQAE